MNILKEVSLNNKNLKIISNQLWNQTACLRLDGGTTEEVIILQGVRQGCILSPLIFNLYSKKIFNKALDGIEAGIQLNKARINNIRYVDDTIILADYITGLQPLMNQIAHHSHKFELNINVHKTKQMVTSKKIILGARLQVNQIKIERVE